MYNKHNAVTKLSECRPAEEEALLVVCATELAQLYTAIAADKVHPLCHVQLLCHVELSCHVLVCTSTPTVLHSQKPSQNSVNQQT